MKGQNLTRWWRRQSKDDLSRTLARYEEQAESHRQAAERAQRVGSEAAYAHQMELKGWYEQEADKLRQKLAKREHTR